MGVCFHYESHTERTSAEDIALSGDGKAGKGGQLKQKTKKRHGSVFSNCNLTPYLLYYNSLRINCSYNGNDCVAIM